MSEAALKAKLEEEFSQVNYAAEEGRKGPFAIFQKYLDRLIELIQSSDVVNVPRPQFLDIAGGIYDKYILPIDLPGPVPDTFIDPLLRKIWVNQAGKIYDRLTKAE